MTGRGLLNKGGGVVVVVVVVAVVPPLVAVEVVMVCIFEEAVLWGSTQCCGWSNFDSF